VLRIPGAVYLFETPQDLGRGAVRLPQHTLANKRSCLRRRADKYASLSFLVHRGRRQISQELVRLLLFVEGLLKEVGAASCKPSWPAQALSVQ
jgi:hypothetical protein